ncbi:uncharacterized protein PHALS_04705 [Plasmopara halstedii]|uniref:Uncharacterized protein n=1 Tax=Plasmopara halstedii TaxID=4781 RepID=A0A0P1A985_PLAHL|nr:uncharacterized protein PHALS_04705 [Plasmopara halstedii]CEG37266.1 hypothetical protein PHALS_04705 [Plasmopara halstedii]|eukprot:XP_024573635.1 hypothetical protein PHALS_04705 [Plasmopara halstedii]
MRHKFAIDAYRSIQRVLLLGQKHATSEKLTVFHGLNMPVAMATTDCNSKVEDSDPWIIWDGSSLS